MKVKRYLLLLVLGGIIGGFVGSSMGRFLVIFFINVNSVIASFYIIGLTFYLWKVQKMRLNLKSKSQFD